MRPRPWQRPGGLMLAAGLLLACKPTGSTTAPTAAASSDSKPAAEGAVVETQGPAPSSCRAFVNDEAGVHDVRVDASGKITVRRGGELVMPFEDGVSTVYTEHFGSHWSYGRLMTRTWFRGDPEAEPGSEEAKGSWDGPVPMVDEPDDAIPDVMMVLNECIEKLEPLDDDAHDGAGEAYDWMVCNEERYVDHRVTVRATLGPWLSHVSEASLSDEPYTEDAWSDYETIDVNAEAVELPDELLAGQAIEALREDYFDSIWPTIFEELDDMQDEVEYEEESFRDEAKSWEPSGFAFGFGPDSFYAEAEAYYESSYQDEQGYLIRADIEAPHPSLRPFLPRDISGQLGDAQPRLGWAVDGCMAIEMADGSVHNARGQRTELDLRGQIVGVYFVPPEFDFSVSELRPLPPKRLEGEFTLKDARAAVKAGRYQHGIAILENLQRAQPNGSFSGEICWAYYLDHQYEQAEAACRDALIETDDPRKLAAIAYNLGRVFEAQEDLPEADMCYTTSLELRPNKAVQQRQEQLGL